MFYFPKFYRNKVVKKSSCPAGIKISHDRVGNLKLWLQKLNNACPLFITTNRTYACIILYTINRKMNTALGEYFLLSVTTSKENLQLKLN